jgi:16S rRNA (uracil1498-N3)-methyltransferase
VLLETQGGARTVEAVNLRTLLVPAPLTPGTLVIEGDEAHHGRVVLRLRTGEDVRLADGDGREALGAVTGVGREALEVEVAAVSTLGQPPAALLTIAAALPKGDRCSELVRALTEIGVGAFRPLICDHGERTTANLERLQRISAEALKQCHRGRHLAIQPPATLAQLRAAVVGEQLVLLDPRGGAAAPGAPRPTVLLIGPEGGWSAEELQATADLPRMRLASTILRIETAAIAAAAVWSAAWESRTP